ncbi:UNVERIFIED_CONTAM: protein BREAST CANCER SUSCEPTIBILITY 1 [Sesamum latifolium]|uniref:Protein BREAST CANCER SUSCEPTIBILITY 1 n=1 Tax=Sesamum latifolium TaxID=2727402 RepID=A0AAW2WM86_9LAMI
MADASHLERMGRELKCPICLSLLNSAVSLTCNHVFCNSCIEKSMKAASNCPVCKVPYRRREIRPAPHMDNLVSVYKSMEVASGVNIFVTQNGACTKRSGEDDQTGVNLFEVQNNRQNQVESLDSANQKRQRKGSKGSLVNTQRSSGSNLVKPSFPTKKRVQVPLYPTSETQMEPVNLGSDVDRIEHKHSGVLQRDMHSASEKGEMIFSPFFWLREEEDLEKLSQQTDDNQVMYTPPDAPCFSDIKDSDDEVPCKISPKRGTCISSNNADFIDSEMFEWTQRPCSPELFPSPLALAMQMEDTAQQNGAQEKADAALTETTEAPKISPNIREGLGQKRRMDKTSDSKGGIRTSNKQVNHATETRKSKRSKKTICGETAVRIDPDKVTYQHMQEGSKDNQLILNGKLRKSNKIHSEASADGTNVQTLSNGTEPLTNSNKTAPGYVSASENLEKSSDRSSKIKKSGESSKRTKKTLASKQKIGSKVKPLESETSKGHVNAAQCNEVLVPKSLTNLLPLSNDNEHSNKGIIRRTYKKNINKIPNSLKKVKFCVEGLTKDNCNGIPLSANEQDEMRGQTFQAVQGATHQLAIKVQEKMEKATSSLDGGVLLKCNTSPNTICCAFCQSSKESEASGIMIHYLNGKPVADNHSSRANVIHVHKNCTEWAPNVYFEDDIVINLEAELSRSRRIRCSCCGIKGAALGCYEKSCRKSFHVPCARLTPECRWDCENFVMLCPLHASCQLPNEMPQSEAAQKRKSAPERKSCVQQVKTTGEFESGAASHWKCQKKFKNLVLCCSALTNAEKGTVTEFEKLSGVTILKNWDSSVTHVIASTNEDGACRRTLKFLMGVLEGKWILSIHWIKACLEAGELVDEQHYEISIDIHGIRDGPRLGRLRLLNKQTKLFDGYTFFFMGDFEPSYRGYLHDLVVAAGGKVLNRKPVAGNQAIGPTQCPATTFIIYSLELPDQCRSSNGSSILNHRRASAEALASFSGAAVATNSWILNSIAGYRLQRIGE